MPAGARACPHQSATLAMVVSDLGHGVSEVRFLGYLEELPRPTAAPEPLDLSLPVMRDALDVVLDQQCRPECRHGRWEGHILPISDRACAVAATCVLARMGGCRR